MAEKSEEQGAAMPANTQKIYAFKDALRKTKWPFCRRKTCRRLFITKPSEDVSTLDSSETDPVIQISCGNCGRACQT